MRITFLGDIMVSSDQLSIYSRGTGYDFDDAVSVIQKEFEKSDYIIANLETPVAGKEFGYTKELYSFNTPIELVKALKNARVDMVTTANNHCLDRGTDGLKHTILNLKAENMEYLGTHIKKEKSYIIKKIDNISVGLMAFTYGTNAFANKCYLKHNQRYMVDMLQEQELSNVFWRWVVLNHSLLARVVRKLCRLIGIGQITVPIYERHAADKKRLHYLKKTVKECKKEGVEYIVACLHIGGQYNDEPIAYTKKICRLCRKIGIDAVIANHEHVIHGIDTEIIKEKSFCIYSLGNFLSTAGVTEAPFDKMAQYSVAINLDFNKSNNNEIKMAYSFEIFCSVAEESGKVKTCSLYDYINKSSGIQKEKLLEDNNKIVNKVMQTQNIQYPLQKEYFIAER